MVTQLVMVTSPEGQTGGHEPLNLGKGGRTVQVPEIFGVGRNFSLKKGGILSSTLVKFVPTISQNFPLTPTKFKDPRLGGHRSNHPPLSLSA